ncbi:MAG: hypothetical protein U0228_23195 [Myxococcaceae bacterium]
MCGAGGWSISIPLDDSALQFDRHPVFALFNLVALIGVGLLATLVLLALIAIALSLRARWRRSAPIPHTAR